MLLSRQHRKVHILLLAECFHLAINSCNQMKCPLQDARLHPVMCITHSDTNTHRQTQTHNDPLTVLHPARLVPASVQTPLNGRIVWDAAPPATLRPLHVGSVSTAGTSRTAEREQTTAAVITHRPAAHTLLHRYFLTNTHTDADPWAGPIRQGFLSALRATLDTFTVSLPRPLPPLTHTLMFFHLHQVLFLPFCQNCAQPLFFQSACSQALKGC